MRMVECRKFLRLRVLDWELLYKLMILNAGINIA